MGIVKSILKIFQKNLIFFVFWWWKELFKDVFNSIINEKNISLYKVIKDTGIPKTIVYDWAAGKREPVSEYVLILADYLGCSVDFLLDRDNQEEIVNVLRVASPVIKPPLLANKSLIADIVYKIPLDINSYISIEDVLASEDDFYVIMQDDSMKNENIYKGTEVLIRRNIMPQSGEIAAVYVDNEIVLRRFFESEGKVILECAGAEVLPSEYDVGAVKILGRGMEIRSLI